ncbi:hypothetical protein DF268_19930 [Streptomyces sp. V2]|uniref:hypothetical protein n=1 Tax=Streptomyces TaxID=1883 RepID=UPI0006EB7E29|nr:MULTISPECIES: hypothetical protein [Streptomyces]PWG11826.1 hypothetical protein DF268_19930 [Streptomyces sp. V2]
MTTAREITPPDATCTGTADSILDAAKRTTDLGAGKDPAARTAGDSAQGEALTLGADDDAAQTMRARAEHKVHRLPDPQGRPTPRSPLQLKPPARAAERTGGSPCARVASEA